MGEGVDGGSAFVGFEFKIFNRGDRLKALFRDHPSAIDRNEPNDRGKQKSGYAEGDRLGLKIRRQFRREFRRLTSHRLNRSQFCCNGRDKNDDRAADTQIVELIIRQALKAIGEERSQ